MFLHELYYYCFLAYITLNKKEGGARERAGEVSGERKRERDGERQRAWKAYLISKPAGFFHKAGKTVKTLFLSNAFICATCYISGIKLNWKTVGKSTFLCHMSTSTDPLSVVYTQTTH